MNITTARKVAANPTDYTAEDMHEALDFIIGDERFSEKQVTKMQAAIEAGLKERELEGMVSVTFEYEHNKELGPQPEDISVHVLDCVQAAGNLASYNLDNDGLVSVTIRIHK